MSSRTYLVTGASRGIGLAVSTLLARHGHHVIGLARNVQGIDFPGELRACDLADIEQTAATLTRIGEEHAVDGIVNNAGIVMPQPLGQIDFRSLQTVFDLNVRAAIQVTQHFADAMKARGTGASSTSAAGRFSAVSTAPRTPPRRARSSAARARGRSNWPNMA